MKCDHNNFKEIKNINGISLYKCDNCKLIFTDKYLGNFDPKTLYKKYYNEISGRFLLGIEYVIKMLRFFRAFKVFTICSHSKSILDIGSGRGFMLYYLKNYYKYIRTAGTQISKNAFEFSKNKLGLEIYDKDLLELTLANGSFNVISILHVLEHVTQPEKYIEKIYQLLDKNGKLIIEVPNYSSWTRKLAGKYWLSLDLDYHLTFFTPEYLSGLLEKNNFKIKTVHTFSLEYSTFTSTQSLVSFITGTPHLFFQYLQTDSFNGWIILQIFLFVFLTPMCFLVNVLLYPTNKGEVLFIVAKK